MRWPWDEWRHPTGRAGVSCDEGSLRPTGRYRRLPNVGVQPGLLRNVNRGAVLAVLRDGPRSRAALARETGLAKPTVSAIAEELLAEGLVRVGGVGTAQAAGGRRPELLELDPGALSYLGVHFGVRHVQVALADATGAIRASRNGPATPRNPERALRLASSLAGHVLEEAGSSWSRVAAAAVAVPGTVERSTGRCRLAPNLGWRDVAIAEPLSARWGCRVVACNIAQAGALAEAAEGVARDVASFVWLYVGTGVGAAIVERGRLVEGRDGFAGEIGHMPIRAGGRRCGCGRRGCLETVSSGPAIARTAARAGLGARPSAVRSPAAAGPLETDGPGEPVRAAGRLGTERPVPAAGASDAEWVAERAASGDALAEAAIRTAAEALGRGVATLVDLLNPELVVVGGGVAGAGEVLLRPLRASLADHGLPDSLAPVVASDLGALAELRGAIRLAMDAASTTMVVERAATARG